jgi:hypothetical protein
MLVVRLLAPSPVANNRITLARGASPQDHVAAAPGPIRFELVRLNAKWDKQNRRSSELCLWLDLPRSGPEAELLPPEAKFQLEENIPLRGYRFFRAVTTALAGYNRPAFTKLIGAGNGPRCTKTVPIGNTFERWSLASSEKQMPQVVENIGKPKQGMEGLEVGVVLRRQGYWSQDSYMKYSE